MTWLYIFRNPDNSFEGSWCFVMQDGVVDREMCSIELCPGKHEKQITLLYTTLVVRFKGLLIFTVQSVELYVYIYLLFFK